MEENKNNSLIVKIGIYIFLSLLAVIYILPLIWMVVASLKSKTEFLLKPFNLPEKVLWDNYSKAWNAGKLGRATLNSVIICAVALIIALVVSAMAAFAIARMKFALSKVMKIYFLIGMMVPVHCVLIPLYNMFKQNTGLGLTNTYLGLIIPYATFALPMTIFILTGFFAGMPGEMFESACIDGCSIYSCFFKIALPLSKTGLFVTGMMAFIGNWNELLVGMVFMNDMEMKTLPSALTSFMGTNSTNYTFMFAAIVIAVIPSIVVYCAFSNKIVDGLTQGAVKG